MELIIIRRRRRSRSRRSRWWMYESMDADKDLNVMCARQPAINWWGEDAVKINHDSDFTQQQWIIII